jgi:dCTP deaminase
MLSNVSIKKYLGTRDIIISPWSDKMQDASRITLHLGSNILLSKSNSVVDVVKKTLPKYSKIKTTSKKPFPLKPGMFVISETFEKVGLSEKIGMILDGRSTLARLGLTVTQSAIIIDSGQKPKKITLEIKNNGPNTILLYPKMKFCKACFFLLNPPATMRYDTNPKYKIDDTNKPIFIHELKEE